MLSRVRTSNGTILCSIDAASLLLSAASHQSVPVLNPLRVSVRCQTNTIRIVLRSSSGSHAKPAKRYGLLDATMVVKDHDDVLVPRGHHPCGAPYGFDIYYLHVMAGPLRK